jgi:hypothetical protein
MEFIIFVAQYGNDPIFARNEHLAKLAVGTAYFNRSGFDGKLHHLSSG